MRPRGRASGRRLPATLRTLVSTSEHALHRIHSNDTADEYTALQKYISTYRDPKAGDPDAAEANAADAGKGKAWWQFWRSGNSGQSTTVDPGFVPDEYLEADIKQGISSNDVEQRRKRYGWNEITTEKENLFIKFLGFFTGPVLYGKFLRLTINAQLHVLAQWLRGDVCYCFCKL